MLVKDVSPVSSQNNKATSQTETGMKAAQSSWMALSLVGSNCQLPTWYAPMRSTHLTIRSLHSGERMQKTVLIRNLIVAN